MIVALPAILAAFLMVLTTNEPERGATEDALKVGLLSMLPDAGRDDENGAVLIHGYPHSITCFLS